MSDTAIKPESLNVGCGSDIKANWINLDRSQLPGVNVVHDLDVFPWPFPQSSMGNIRIINVMEHLSDATKVLEELHRLAAPECTITIRVPCVNGPDAFSDPTHKIFFNQHSFDFFDPSTRHGKERSYYSTAKFHIKKRIYYSRIIPGLPYLKVRNAFLRFLMSGASILLGGVIWSVEVEMVPLK